MKTPHRYGVAYRLWRGDQVALIRRPDKGLLGGMLATPTSDWRAKAWTAAEALSAAPTKAAWRDIGDVEHVFTHFSLTLTVYEVSTETADNQFIWTNLVAAAASTPTVFRKVLELG